MTIRLGLQIPNFSYGTGVEKLFPSVIAQAREAEAAGYDSLFVMDHFYQLPMLGTPDQPMLEAYTALGALATATERLQLGALVTGNTYRSPTLLAKIITTLDVVSAGRAILGIGAKGSMATVSRFSAVAKIGPVEFSGFIAWLIWLVLHLAYLIGFKTKITTLLSWTVTFLSTRRGQLTITDQQAFARTRLEQLAELAAEAQGSAASAKVAS